ncbi:MAG: hypothetical protein AAF182_04565 [Pseudomonadota bacterium]
MNKQKFIQALFKEFAGKEVAVTPEVISMFKYDGQTTLVAPPEDYKGEVLEEPAGLNYDVAENDPVAEAFRNAVEAAGIDLEPCILTPTQGYFPSGQETRVVATLSETEEGSQIFKITGIHLD